MKLNNPIVVDLTLMNARVKKLNEFSLFTASRVDIEDADIKKIAIQDVEERNRLVTELSFLERDICAIIANCLKE